MTVKNCTIADNVIGGAPGPEERGAGISGTSQTIVTDSIVRGNIPEQTFGLDCGNVSYSNIQDSDCLGSAGNIADDPLFIGPGYWANVHDPNIVVEPDDPNAVWVMGDYHLSQIAAGQGVDSPCVDAGSDTAVNVGMGIYDTTRTDRVLDEGIVDMGYHYRQNVADLNGDGIVDMGDLAILCCQWDQEPAEPSADIAPPTAGDGIVDARDLAMIVDSWLWP